MKRKRIYTGTSIAVLSGILLSGCGFYSNEEPATIDPPMEVTYTDKKLSEIAQGDKNALVSIDLYVRDQKSGYLLPVTTYLPSTSFVMKQAVEHLVRGDKALTAVGSNFTALLPEGTKVKDVVQENDTVTVDLSKEFTKYKAKDEQEIMQSLAWTLTQFESVKNVKLKVEGQELTEMPVGKTPIYSSLNRSLGINNDTDDVVDVTSSTAATIYYVSQKGSDLFYVPITKRITVEEGKSEIESIVSQLIRGARDHGMLATEFNKDVKLLDYKQEGEVVTLNFNKNILTNPKANDISPSLLNALTLSLTEGTGISAVEIAIEGKTTEFTVGGKEMTAPVSRPKHVNVGEF